VDGVYGYVYAYDVKATPPKLVGSIALNKDPQDRPRPGWMSFSLDGKYRLSRRWRGDRHGNQENRGAYSNQRKAVGD